MREIVEVHLVLWLLIQKSESGTSPAAVIALACLIGTNISVTPWLMSFASEEIVVLVDVFFDCCYGSLFPFCTAIIPAVQNLNGNAAPTNRVEGMLIGKE